MIKKILTIGIPTFNGALALMPNIDNLISIIKKNNLIEEINILVSINASTDNSEEICKKYTMYNYFNYYIQPENIGYDANVNSIVTNSMTPYVWLSSDDDLITEKGILKAIEILKKDKPSYIFINHDKSPLKNNDREYKIYNDREMFINEMRFSCGLISSNIVFKEYWIKWQIDKYINTHWIHMGYIIELLNHSPGNYVSVFNTDCLVNAVFHSGRTWGNNGTFLNTGFLLVNMILFNLDKNCKHGLYWGRKIIAGAYPDNIYRARCEGLKLTKEIKNNIKLASSYNMIKYYFLVLPSILMPNFLAKLFWRCYRKAKHILTKVLPTK